MSSPLDTLWKAVKRILRCLSGTVDNGLIFSKSDKFSLVGFSYADWASDRDDRRSTSGYRIYLDGNLVSWSSKKQAVVSRSSTEAEYQSVAAATAELTWIQSLLKELHVSLFTTPLL